MATQDPFHLHEYIAERRTKLRSNSSKNQLQLAHITKLHSDRATSSNRDSSALQFQVTFYKNACLNVKNGSPDLKNRASPVFNLPKSPVKLLHIPSKTAAMLLEAALRIHKHSSQKRTNKFGTDFGFFGSVLKKLYAKTHKRNSIDAAKHQTMSSSESRLGKMRRDSNLCHSDSDMDLCFNGRRSDAVWSEDKSLDTETSCSSSNSRTVVEHTRSPSRCPSSDFSSRPPSPSRRTVKDEKEQEQCSPVCVLDPLFEEDENDRDQDENDDEYGCECSYAIVERKKQQLLHKLSRFEALVDLDPKDLQKLILEDELYAYPESEMLEEKDDIASEFSLVPADYILRKVLEKCGFNDLCSISVDMKRLVSDLIAKEVMKDELLTYTNENDVVNTVCAKFSSWNGVQLTTIDMMVG